MRDTRPGIDQDIDGGCLVVTDGFSDGEAMYQFFEESFLKASKQGIQGLQVLGDMAWVLKKRMSVEALTCHDDTFYYPLTHFLGV